MQAYQLTVSLGNELKRNYEKVFLIHAVMTVLVVRTELHFSLKYHRTVGCNIGQI